MLSASHTIISLPFGIFFDNPILIFVATFALHFVFDAMYHWNIYPPNFRRFPVVLISLDVIGGLVLAWLIIGNQITTLPVIAAIFGSNAPDILQTIWSFFGKPVNKRYPILTYLFKMHDRIQWETDSMLKGMVPQTIFIFLAAFLAWL